MSLNRYILLSNPSFFGSEKHDLNKKNTIQNALSDIELLLTTKNVVKWISGVSKYSTNFFLRNKQTQTVNTWHILTT